jgi:hypothetical protein
MRNPKQRFVMGLSPQKQAVVLGLCVGLLCFVPFAAAQAPKDMRGRIVDLMSRELLPDVDILLIELEQRAKTDDSGMFIIPNLPPGSYSLQFSLEGYKTLFIKEFQIPSVSKDLLLVEMEPAATRLTEEVTVIGKPPRTPHQNSLRPMNLDSEEVSRMPGTGEDLTRALRIMPGASHVGELSNDLVVRGGSPWENGFYIDNMAIPNINHMQYQGGGGGVLTMINTQFIEDIRFYTGGFSIAYGDRMSSITDLSFRRGNPRKRNILLNLNTAGFGGSFEGPWAGDKGTVMLSLRRSYHDYVTNLVGYGVAPRFGDFHFKMTYDLNPRNRITLLNLYGDSKFVYDIEKALQEGLNNYLNYKTNQNTLGLNWLSSWHKQGYSETSLSYSFYKSIYSLSEVTSTAERLATDVRSAELNLRNVNSFWVSGNTQLEWGMEVKYEDIRFNNNFAERTNRWEIVIPESSELGEQGALKSGLFLAYTHHPIPQLALSLGCRLDYFSYNRNWLFSPRLTTTWELGRKSSLSGSVGFFRQTLPLFLLAGNPQNKQKKDPISLHLVLSFNHEVSAHTLLSLTLYSKTYQHLPLVESYPDTLVMDKALNYGFYQSYDEFVDTGVAYSRGIELLLKKQLMENLYGLVSFTYFRSRFKDFYGTWRNRLNDNRYLLSLVGGYHLNAKWQISARSTLAGGVPYSAINIERSTLNNKWIIDQTQINSKRYPAYFTLNVRVDRCFQFQHSNLNLYLSIMNLLNRKNVQAYYWNVIDNAVDTIYQFPILPLFGIEYIF